MTELVLPRGHGGEATRKRELTLGPAMPWHTTITVDAVGLWRGRHTLTPHETVFEVAAEWTGPPAKGFPPSPEPVQSRDVYAVADLDLARALARRAAQRFARGGTPPDLRELAAELKRRST